MKKMFLFTVFLLVTQTANANTNDDVRSVVLDIREAVAAGKLASLPQSEQQQILGQLQDVRDQINNSTQQRAVFACVINATGYYVVTDLATGETIGGNYNSLDSCKRSLPKPGQIYACVINPTGYYGVFNLLKKHQIGGNLNSMDSCSKTLPQNGTVYACLQNATGYYGIFNLALEKQISGNYNSLDSCLNSLPH